MTLARTANSFGQIIGKFPSQGFPFCFAYGSGVKSQLGYSPTEASARMIDLVCCVEDPKQWHRENMKLNPDHYSGLKYLGSWSISKIQQNFGANVYCNTLIPITKDLTIKYGVISTKHLIQDLTEWNKLYMAGGLHKPIEIVHLAESHRIIVPQAINTNYKNAVATSLLLLPEMFTPYDLFYTIASLSYDGDFRMVFGENKNKVANIVKPQLAEFYNLYQPTLQTFSENLELPTKNSLIDKVTLHQNKDPAIVTKYLGMLPATVADGICKKYYKYVNRECKSKKDAFAEMAYSPLLSELIQQTLNKIVWNSSVSQSLKNIPTAGVTKAIRYSWRKAMKTFQSNTVKPI